jgi:hypothetical protein
MEDVSQSTKVGKKLAPFNPASAEVVDTALELLQIKDNDVIYDLGCGDARLLVKVGNAECKDQLLAKGSLELLRISWRHCNRVSYQIVQACSLNPTIRAVGIEYDSDIYQRACALVAGSGLPTEQIRVLHDNVLNVDFSEATCIFVYLVPEGMAMLRNSFLEALGRGVRIVSYGTQAICAALMLFSSLPCATFVH